MNCALSSMHSSRVRSSSKPMWTRWLPEIPMHRQARGRTPRKTRWRARCGCACSTFCKRSRHSNHSATRTYRWCIGGGSWDLICWACSAMATRAVLCISPIIVAFGSPVYCHRRRLPPRWQHPHLRPQFPLSHQPSLTQPLAQQRQLHLQPVQRHHAQALLHRQSLLQFRQSLLRRRTLLLLLLLHPPHALAWRTEYRACTHW
mmetsp:Transcript_18164/g.54597  ORF Transcript_18164/g.54597 Transcript_18164/m.54597 type:complete len:203 (-) Transcript_18164:669-1277(-)